MQWIGTNYHGLVRVTDAFLPLLADDARVVSTRCCCGRCCCGDCCCCCCGGGGRCCGGDLVVLVRCLRTSGAATACEKTWAVLLRQVNISSGAAPTFVSKCSKERQRCCAQQQQQRHLHQRHQPQPPPPPPPSPPSQQRRPHNNRQLTDPAVTLATISAILADASAISANFGPKNAEEAAARFEAAGLGSGAPYGLSKAIRQT